MPRGVTATISVSAFTADWLAHVPMRGLCERWTISRDQVVRLKHVWHLPPRHDRRLRAKPIRQRDPTPSEIKKACALIQSSWSDDTREDRRVVKSKPVTLQRIEVPDEIRDAADDPTSEVQW